MGSVNAEDRLATGSMSLVLLLVNDREDEERVKENEMSIIILLRKKFLNKFSILFRTPRVFLYLYLVV